MKKVEVIFLLIVILSFAGFFKNENICMGSQDFYGQLALLNYITPNNPAIFQDLNRSYSPLSQSVIWQTNAMRDNTAMNWQYYVQDFNKYIINTSFLPLSKGIYEFGNILAENNSFWTNNTGSDNMSLCGDGGSNYLFVEPFIAPWYLYNPSGAIWGGVMNTSLWPMIDMYDTGIIEFNWSGVIPSLTYYDWSWIVPWYSGRKSEYSRIEAEYSDNGGIDPEDGVTIIHDLAMFETMACMSDVPGALNVREVKFLVVGVDTDNPAVYFYNTKKHTYHFTFARDVLKIYNDLYKFNSQTYFTDYNRKNLAGSIIAYDNYQLETGEKGIYAIEFWPSDPVRFKFVKIAYDLITDKMPFAGAHIAYHAVGEIQRNLFEEEKFKYENSYVKTISSEDLFENIAYSPLNIGESYGLLRIIESDEVVTAKDIVIFKTAPNDLTHVAGIITETPQTPLSHINLKAKQNNTPNIYIKNASAHPEIVPFVGQYVHFQITSDGFAIEAANQKEVDDFFESIRPSLPQSPVRDLSVTTIAALNSINASDFSAYGVKAANVAELAKFLPYGMVPDGFAVPFYFYDEFMKYNNFYQEAADMLADEVFKNDPQVRQAALAAFRKRIKQGEAPQWMDNQLQEVYDDLRNRDNNRDVRARSSTNNEDLEGFNGAGLYESYTHKPDEGRFINTIRQVWSGLWTYRAFEERDFYRIDHFKAAMGVLVHHNYKNEIANGVAVTKNIFDPNWEGFYVNVQVGEDLVTNPEEESIPDEFLVARIPVSNWQIDYEIVTIRHSNKTGNGENVLSDNHIQELISAMAYIQEHFRKVYHIAENDLSFAMDIEFKVTQEDELHIKQARPWID
ncbi:MAG: PEP/pyruvate-binding domain-containing protein [bacterium]